MKKRKEKFDGKRDKEADIVPKQYCAGKSNQGLNQYQIFRYLQKCIDKRIKYIISKS